METLNTPYYAVIFTSRKSAQIDGYDKAAERMQILCAAQPGFIRMVHATTDDGDSVTTCYWEDLASISAWKSNSEHQAVQDQGIARWYDEYHIEIARIERSYHWQRS
jgi:heme-degrading monooxygenase HmoA